MSEKITRVLLVEDDPPHAEMMDKSLDEHKSEIIAHANSLHESQPEFYESHPELKMSDLGVYARPLLEANPEFSIVGEFQTGKDALAACGELSPDVIVLCQPQEMSQFEFIESLSKAYPKIGLVVARHTWGEDEMRDMMLLGVRYILFRPFQTPHFYVILKHAKEDPPPNYKLKGSILG